MRSRAVPAATLLVLVLASCAYGDEEEPLGAGAGAGPTTTTAPATPTTTAASAPPAPASAAAPEHDVDDVVLFDLPSGNIGCALDATAARCDILEAEWQPPPAPGDCDLAYGHGIVLADGAPALLCAGDTVGGGGDVLGYGESITRGPFRCESAETGVTCRNTDTGAGFRLSRGAYELSA